MFNLDSKCANPKCQTIFHWQLHGKFYRFYRDGSHEHSYSLWPNSTSGGPAVEHFWLCEGCSRFFTLAWEHDGGIVLRYVGMERRSESRDEKLTPA